MTTIRDAIEIAINADGARARKEFEAVGASARKELGSAENKSKQMAAKFKAAGVGMSVTAGVLGVALASTVGPASDLNESASKSKVIFKGAAGEIDKFATNASKIGLSKQAALEATASFGGLFQNVGKTADESANMSKRMVTLASDMASFSNASPEEALQAIQAGLRGEAEPLRRFNVLLDDATLRQEALKQGMIQSTSQALTPQQKTLAAYNVILAQTGAAQGDFARTSDGLANQQRILAANVENAKAAIGSALLPTMTTLTSVVNSAVGGFTNLDPAMQTAFGKFAGYTTLGIGAGGALSFIAGKALDLRETLAPLGEDGARSLTKMGKAAVGLGAVGIGIGLVSAAVEYFGRESETAGASVDELVQKVRQGSTVGAVFRDDLSEIVSTSDEIRSGLKGAGISVEQFSNAITGTDEGTRKMELALRAARKEVDKGSQSGIKLAHAIDQTRIALLTQRDKFKDLKEEAKAKAATDKELANSQRDLTRAVDLSSDAFGAYSNANSKAASDAADAAQKAELSAQGKLTELVATKGITAALADEIVARRTAKDGTVDYVAAADDAAKAAESQKKATNALSNAWDRNTTALRDNLDEQRKVRDAQRGSITSVLDLADAVDDAREKQKAYNDLVKAGKGNTVEGKAALRDYQRAFLDVAAATDEAAQAQVDAAAAQSGFEFGTRNSVVTASKFRAKLRELQATFPQLRDEIQKYIDKVNSIPRDVVTHVTISSDGSVTANGVTHRARGGDVRKGQPYIVGEKRPELFVPDSNGTIIPNVPRSTNGRAYSNDNSGGVVINMNVVVNDATDPQKVVRALDTAFKKDGSRLLRRWALTA